MIFWPLSFHQCLNATASPSDQGSETSSCRTGQHQSSNKTQRPWPIHRHLKRYAHWQWMDWHLQQNEACKINTQRVNSTQKMSYTRVESVLPLKDNIHNHLYFWSWMKGGSVGCSYTCAFGWAWRVKWRVHVPLGSTLFFKDLSLVKFIYRTQSTN